MSLEEYQQKAVTHKLSELKPGYKNIDIRVIVLEKVHSVELKKNKDVLNECIVGDSSGVIRCNLFGDVGV
jgi:hypothetical protein